jgi:hypothetical protein
VIPRFIATLSTSFIYAMVQAMYAEERSQINNPALLTEPELMDFYAAYMGGPL